jgi:hypothetical protein
LERITLELPGMAAPLLAGEQESEGAGAVKVASKNLCADGAYLVSEERLPPSERIQLHLKWPCGSELVATADVLRVELLGQDAYGYAVRFITGPDHVTV